MAITNELLDQLIKDYKPEDLIGENGLLKQLLLFCYPSSPKGITHDIKPQTTDHLCRPG